MVARPAVALCLAALAWPASALAQDDPRCAKYSEPMAYNACLARQGPKANAIGQVHGGGQPARAAPHRASYGHRSGAPGPRSYLAQDAPGGMRFYETQGSQHIHGRVHMEFRVH
jgi:hypothetical protein